jgi:hypothetical protein
LKKLTGFAKALILLSIAVPMSLLVIFKLTGVLHDPIVISGATTLETIKWEFERPHHGVSILETAEGSYGDNNISILYSVFMGGYREGSGRYGSSDYVLLTTNVTATVRDGYIESVHLVFREDYENARINFFQEHQFFRLENLSIVDLKDWSKQVFVNLSGVNRPTSVYFWTPVDWVLQSPGNQTHRMEIISEVTYFNGTAYRKVVQPFQLKIGPDANNSFERAQKIEPGSFRACIDTENDLVDYYKIWLEWGQTVQVELPDVRDYRTAAPNIDIYDPNYVLKARLKYDTIPTLINFTANSTGWWYIVAKSHPTVFAIYVLNVSVLLTEGSS